MNIREVSEKIHINAIQKGFWLQKYRVDKMSDSEEFSELFSMNQLKATLKLATLALVISEICEAIEGIRKDELSDKINCKAEDEEVADAIIRLLDYCAAYKIDIEKIIEMKMAYNEGREYMHGGKLL